MTTKTCSMDLRERIVAAKQEGHSSVDISKWYRVSKSSVDRYWRSYQQQGSVKPKQRGGYRRSRLESHDETLREWLKEDPSLTLSDLEQRCEEDLGVKIHQTALWHRLRKLDMSFKKNATRQGAGS